MSNKRKDEGSSADRADKKAKNGATTTVAAPILAPASLDEKVKELEKARDEVAEAMNEIERFDQENVEMGLADASYDFFETLETAYVERLRAVFDETMRSIDCRWLMRVLVFNQTHTIISWKPDVLGGVRHDLGGVLTDGKNELSPVPTSPRLLVYMPTGVHVQKLCILRAVVPWDEHRRQSTREIEFKIAVDAQFKAEKALRVPTMHELFSSFDLTTIITGYLSTGVYTPLECPEHAVVVVT